MEVIKTLSVLVACVTLVACGGGGGGSELAPAPSPAPAPAPVPAPAAAPTEPAAVTSVIAGDYTDAVKLSAFNRVNELRGLAGLGLVRQDSAADLAAQAHSDYQANNYVLSHGETPGRGDRTFHADWCAFA